MEAVSFSGTLLFTSQMASHSKRLEILQIIVSFTFRALAQLNVLQILAGWLVLCILEVMEDANYNPMAGCCDRGLSCFSSGSSGKYQNCTLNETNTASLHTIHYGPTVLSHDTV
jgi:hypothetical protein